MYILSIPLAKCERESESLALISQVVSKYKNNNLFHIISPFHITREVFIKPSCWLERPILTTSGNLVPCHVELARETNKSEPNHHGIRRITLSFRLTVFTSCPALSGNPRVSKSRSIHVLPERYINTEVVHHQYLWSTCRRDQNEKPLTQQPSRRKGRKAKRTSATGWSGRNTGMCWKGRVRWWPWRRNRWKDRPKLSAST